MSDSARNPMSLVATLAGMVLALFITFSVLDDSGNALAGLFFYLLLASAGVALASPRFSFVILILLSAYLDLFKRLMIIGGKISFNDLYWVLGIAPVTVVCIAAGLVLRMIFGQVKFDGSDVRRLAGAVVLNLVLAAFVFLKGGGITGTLREVANGASYSLLLFIVPLLYPTPESVARISRFIVYAFVPVAAYGIYQQAVGFMDFEIEYLKTPGLTIEIKQLEANRVRAFSTLNSPTSLSVVVCSVAAMAMSLAIVGNRARASLMSVPVAFFVLLLMVGGWAASTVRVGILLIPVALAGMYLFRHGSATRRFYAFLIFSFALLVAFSDYLYQNIEGWTRSLMEVVGDSSFASYLLNMNSYKDRLYGFANVLANPSAYTLFGMGEDGRAEELGFYAHDPVSNALISMGVVPLAIGLTVCAFVLLRLHRVVYEMRNKALQLFAASFLANAAGNVAVSMINGNLLGVFPVNVFFWACLGFAITLRRADADLASRTQPESQPAPAPSRVVQSFPGRFAPVPRLPLR